MFGHVEKKPIDFVVRRVNEMEISQTTRGREKHRKIIRKTIKISRLTRYKPGL